MAGSDTGPRAADSGSPAPLPARAPVGLRIAAGIVALEGLLVIGYGVSELLHLSSGRLIMGLTTAAFFLAYGAGLIACGWGLARVRTWARGPVLLAQLIWLGLAWNFRHGETLPIAIGLAVPAAVVLAAMLVPSSLQALNDADGD